MKLIQKWMVVPWKENKEMTPSEKIKEIYASKTIDESNKQRLINKILNDSIKKDEILEIQNATTVDESVDEPKIVDSIPTEIFETNDFVEEISERKAKKRKREKKQATKIADQTFENANDYLPPGEQTRSKTKNRKSLLNLSKQKKYTNKVPAEFIFNPGDALVRWEKFITKRNAGESK